KLGCLGLQGIWCILDLRSRRQLRSVDVDAEIAFVSDRRNEGGRREIERYREESVVYRYRIPAAGREGERWTDLMACARRGSIVPEPERHVDIVGDRRAGIEQLSLIRKRGALLNLGEQRSRDAAEYRAHEKLDSVMFHENRS